MGSSIVELDGESLTIDSFINIISNHPKINIAISKKCKEKIINSYNIVLNMVNNNKVVYGITTGFGSLKRCVISNNEISELQKKFNFESCSWYG